MIEALLISETSVYFKKTVWHFFPEGHHLHTFCKPEISHALAMLSVFFSIYFDQSGMK
jgi:hypothetical protein